MMLFDALWVFLNPLRLIESWYTLAGGGGGAPQPTAEERELQRTQTELLRQQQSLLERQLREQDLLSPLILGELGIERVTGQAPNPEFQRLQSRLTQIDQQLTAPAAGGFGALRGVAGRQLLERERATIAQQLQSTPQTIESLTGYQRRAPTPEELQQQTLEQRFRDLTLAELEAQAVGAPQRAEIETLTRERTLKALRGELDIDPTLTRELEQQEMTLREQLRAQLGPGYETSTPGIQALADFQRRRAELIFGAQRGEITLGEQLAGAREARGFERGAAFLPATQVGAQLRESRLGQIFGFGTPGRGVDFGQLAGAFGDPLARAAQERMTRAQISAQGRSDWFRLFGTAAGATIGGIFGGPAGAVAGASLGSGI